MTHFPKRLSSPVSKDTFFPDMLLFKLSEIKFRVSMHEMLSHITKSSFTPTQKLISYVATRRINLPLYPTASTMALQ